MLFRLLLTLYLTRSLQASPRSSLSRSQRSVRYGNFKTHLYKVLPATVIKTLSVQIEIDCLLHCIKEESCYSVNTGTYLTAEKIHFCELLATDKYRATEKLQANISYHHFSPWVSQIMYCTCSLLQAMLCHKLHLLALNGSICHSEMTIFHTLSYTSTGEIPYPFLSEPSHISLISRVFGPYCKLRTEFFLIDGKKRGSVIYSTDRKNEANKMFIIWLLPV